MFFSKILNLSSVLCYFLVLVMIAVLKKKSKDFHSFSKGNVLSKGSYFVFISSIFVSSIGGGTIVGLSEKIHSGAMFYAYAAILAIIFDVLIAKYIVPRLSKRFYNLHSVGEIFSVYYGKYGKILGGMSSCVTSLGLVAAQLNVSGKVFEYILNIDHRYGIALSLAIVLTYTSLGGISSILVSNKMQFFAIITSVPILAVFAIKDFDINLGKQVLSYSMQNHQILTLAVLLNFLSMNLFPNFIQRVTLTNNYKLVQNSIYIKSIIYFFLLIFIIVNAIASIKIFPDIDSKFALPSLIEELIPFYFQPFIIIGIFASITSTIDSDINISSIAIVKDVMQTLFPKALHDQNLVFFTRLMTLILGFISANMALMFEYVLDLVIFFAGFWGSVVLPGLVFLIFGVVVKKKLFLLISLLGLAVFIFYEVLFPKNILKGVSLGFLVNVTGFCICTLIQKHHR